MKPDQHLQGEASVIYWRRSAWHLVRSLLSSGWCNVMSDPVTFLRRKGASRTQTARRSVVPGVGRHSDSRWDSWDFTEPRWLSDWSQTPARVGPENVEVTDTWTESQSGTPGGLTGVKRLQLGPQDCGFVRPSLSERPTSKTMDRCLHHYVMLWVCVCECV